MDRASPPRVFSSAAVDWALPAGDLLQSPAPGTSSPEPASQVPVAYPALEDIDHDLLEAFLSTPEGLTLTEIHTQQQDDLDDAQITELKEKLGEACAEVQRQGANASLSMAYERLLAERVTSLPQESSQMSSRELAAESMACPASQAPAACPGLEDMHPDLLGAFLSTPEGLTLIEIHTQQRTSLNATHIAELSAKLEEFKECRSEGQKSSLAIEHERFVEEGVTSLPHESSLAIHHNSLHPVAWPSAPLPPDPPSKRARVAEIHPAMDPGNRSEFLPPAVFYLTKGDVLTKDKLPQGSLRGLFLEEIKNNSLPSINKSLSQTHNKSTIRALSLSGTTDTIRELTKQGSVTLCSFASLVSLNLSGFGYSTIGNVKKPDDHRRVLKCLLDSSLLPGMTTYPLKALGLSFTHVSGKSASEAIIALLTKSDQKSRREIPLFTGLEVLDLHGIYLNGEQATEAELAEMRSALVNHRDSNGNRIWPHLGHDRITVTQEEAAFIDWIHPYWLDDKRIWPSS